MPHSLTVVNDSITELKMSLNLLMTTLQCVINIVLFMFIAFSNGKGGSGRSQRKVCTDTSWLSVKEAVSWVALILLVCPATFCHTKY